MPISTSSITSLQNTGGTSVLSSQKASYGDNPFLVLLTEQLKNQTPLEPVNNESFVNQMASYTTMNEQRDLNNNLLKLLDYQGVLARMNGISEGSALLGKDVTFTNAEGQEETAKVESVYINDNGDVHLRLEGDKDIDMREVHGIAQAAAAS
ncbi:MAG: flagellar hook capping FlgD N-terminal domain-containing protein [Planctomycetota bacterium]